MSVKEWGLTFLAQILASPILLAVSLITVAVLFIIAYATLVVFGLVSAVLYGAGGLILIWIIGSASPQTLSDHWYIVLIVPALFIFGLISDRVSSLGLSLVPTIEQGLTLSYNDVATGASVVVYGPYMVAVLSLVASIIALISTILLKRKFWWVGRRKKR